MALVLSRDAPCGMENFRIVIQPIVSTLNGRAIGGEVLLRWKFGGKDVLFRQSLFPCWKRTI